MFFLFIFLFFINRSFFWSGRQQNSRMDKRPRTEHVCILHKHTPRSVPQSSAPDRRWQHAIFWCVALLSPSPCSDGYTRSDCDLTRSKSLSYEYRVDGDFITWFVFSQIHFAWELVQLEAMKFVHRSLWSHLWYEQVFVQETSKVTRMYQSFVLRKKGSKTKKRMKEEEIEKGDCGPPTPKVFFFWDFVGLEPSGT